MATSDAAFKQGQSKPNDGSQSSAAVDTRYLVAQVQQSKATQGASGQALCSYASKPDIYSRSTCGSAQDDALTPHRSDRRNDHRIDNLHLIELSEPDPALLARPGVRPTHETYGHCVAVPNARTSCEKHNVRLPPLSTLSSRSSTTATPPASSVRATTAAPGRHSLARTGLVQPRDFQASGIQPRFIDIDQQGQLPDLRIASHPARHSNALQHPLSTVPPTYCQTRLSPGDTTYPSLFACGPSYPYQDPPTAFYPIDPRQPPVFDAGLYPLSVQQSCTSAPVLYSQGDDFDLPMMNPGYSHKPYSHYTSSLHRIPPITSYAMQHPFEKYPVSVPNMVSLPPHLAHGRSRAPPPYGRGTKLFINTSLSERPMCVVCSGTNAPWRRGPLGLRTLCNSCGHIKNSGREATNYDEAIQMLEDLRLARIKRVRRRHDSQDISEMLRNLQSLPESTLILARARFPARERSAISLYASSSGNDFGTMGRSSISSSLISRRLSSDSVHLRHASRIISSATSTGCVRPRVLTDVYPPDSRSDCGRQNLRQVSDDEISPNIEADAIEGLLQAGRATSEKTRHAASLPTPAVSNNKRIKLPSIANLRCLPPSHAYRPMTEMSRYTHGRSAPTSPTVGTLLRHHQIDDGVDAGMMRSKSCPGWNMHITASTMDTEHTVPMTEAAAGP